jgi:hypothetical protein
MLAAEHQVVMPTDRSPMPRPRPVLMALFSVVMGLSGIGLVFALVVKFKSGTAFERYKNWERMWVSYGEMTVFFVVALVAGIARLIWSRLASRREERLLADAYKKRKGAA